MYEALLIQTNSITDISKLKWAERIHAQAAATAREAKRMQEKFIVCPTRAISRHLLDR